MIKNRLSAILGEQRLNMAEVARGAGLAKATVFKLYHAKSSKIDFEVMDKLCACLGVQPGDLFEYIPGGAQTGAKTGRK